MTPYVYGVGLLRNQVGVAALQEVVLAGRAVQDPASDRELAGTPLADGTPLGVAVGFGSRTAPHGSPGMSNRLNPWAMNSSITFAARTARWKLPRNRMSSIGAQSIPNL